MKLTVYQKPTCTTCRSVSRILKEKGVDFTAVNYYLDPIPKAQLKKLLKKMRMSPSELLRTREPIYKKLRLGEKKRTDAQLIDLLVRYPDLLQRPIVEKGSRAVLARPPEKIKALL